MAMTNEKDFVKMALQDLPFKNDFIEKCAEMGFFKVSDLMELGWTKITESKGFNHRWFGELLRVFEENKMIHLLYNK